MWFSVAKEKMTPDWPVLLGGFLSRTERHTGVFSDIYVKTLFLDDGSEQVLFVVLDLCMIDNIFVARIKNRIIKKYGLVEANILIHTTHIHSGPLTHMTHRISEYKRADTQKWMEHLEAKIMACVDKCMSSKEPGSIEIGNGETYIGVNRRVVTKSGVIFGANYQAPIDRNLFVLKILNQDSKIKVILFNCACHPVEMGSSLLLSSDYPGMACNEIEKKIPGSIAIFMQGACGEINNAITARDSKHDTGVIESKNTIVIGRVLANDVFNVIQRKMKKIKLSIRCKLDVLELPLGENKIESIRELLESTMVNIRNYATWMIDRYESGLIESGCRLYAGLIRLSDDVNLAVLEGEVCNGIGVNIKKVLLGNNTMVLGYSNGYIGYIPTSEIVRQGGYEARSLWMLFGYTAEFSEDIEKTILEYYRRI